MDMSKEEWEAHFQSLDTEVLLDLLASPSLLHRKMVEEIVTSREITPRDIQQAIELRQEIREKAVENSKEIETASRGKWRIAPILISIILIIIMVWGIYYFAGIDNLLFLIIGALMGGFTGFIGGTIGGGISGYFDPLTRIADFDPTARLNFAKSGSESARRLGAIAGFICGAIVGILGDKLPVFAFLLIAGVLFWFAAGWFVRSVGESILGLPWGIVGGAIFGVLGGFASRMITEMILGN